MSAGIIIVEQDGIVEIRLDRTEKKNAMTAAMYDAATDALTEGGLRDSARVFVFTAEGTTFCAGNDMNSFLNPVDELEQSPGWRFIRALAACGKPMVAAVQGAAVGIGTTLLLHCDLVYASPEASLSVPFVSIGLVPEAGSSLLLPHLMGRQRAARMLLLGEAMSAAEAHHAGLVSGIVPLEELRTHAIAKAQALASKPPMALAGTRALMRGDEAALAAHMQREMALFARAVRGPEAREAATAFLEKRAPDFNRLGA
ncbi:enoyl-CoA hydratase [Lichenicoccus sp.]|uniref:enoyl-CoA hydratase n=1 Tax=Lichenicoccus sp. TaxID=2781899 RepID=UPI003D13C8D0